MKHLEDKACRGRVEALWSLWPQAKDLSPGLRRELERCPACGEELASFEAACARAATAAGAPLSWETFTSASRRARLALATRRALVPEAAGRPWAWAGGLAFAAAVGLLFLYEPRFLGAVWRRPSEAVAPAPPELAQNIEFFQKLPELEDLDAVAQGRQEGAL